LGLLAVKNTRYQQDKVKES